jgi:hypothetical protein
MSTSIPSACDGEIGNNVFDRLAESRREVWFGDDGSGLIRSQHIRSLFFTDEQRLLNGIHQLCGEALVPSGLRQDFVDLAADLPDAWILGDAADQLGRPGFGASAPRPPHDRFGDEDSPAEFSAAIASLRTPSSAHRAAWRSAAEMSG